MSIPTPIVRIAFSSAPFADTPSWEDVSSSVVSVAIKRGRQHELGRMEAGTATVVLMNTSGDFWPDNTGGSYYPNVKPLKRINIRVTYDEATYDLYTGFIEDWAPDFILKPIMGPVMVVTCTTLIENLSRLFLNDPTGYSQELSGTRVGNVLDDLGWPAGNRDIDAGQSLMQATGELINICSMDHLFDVQLSELGIFFMAGDGDVQFQDRHARLKSPYTTSQAIFGDDSGEMGYHRLALAYGNQYILNDIRITREGGVEQVATDATSQTNYGKRGLPRTGLLMTADTEALSQAQYLLKQYKDPALRVKSVTTRPGGDEANLYPKVFGYDISTRITMRLNQASLDGDYHIEGVNLSWAAVNAWGWEGKWELSSADSQQYWAIGVAGFGEIGETTYVAY